jgi:hypothetical protein
LPFLGDYRGLIGENIPYRKFGFYNLYDFLDNARDFIRVATLADGTMVARALVSEDTAHLAMVMRFVFFII